MAEDYPQSKGKKQLHFCNIMGYPQSLKSHNFIAHKIFLTFTVWQQTPSMRNFSERKALKGSTKVLRINIEYLYKYLCVVSSKTRFRQEAIKEASIKSTAISWTATASGFNQTPSSGLTPCTWTSLSVLCWEFLEQSLVFNQSLFSSCRTLSTHISKALKKIPRASHFSSS